MLKIFKNVGRGTKTFIPCVRDRCYCLELINKPDKTKITNKLLMNAAKCKKEYYVMKKIWKQHNTYVQNYLRTINEQRRA